MKRDRFIDGLKFILIFLVIFGHCRHFTVYDHSLLSTKIVGHLSRSIYLFHMPLFIMISGYLSKKTDIQKFKKSIFRLFRIYVVFHILWISINVFRGEQVSFERIICPSFTLWYLLSLIYWRIILQLIPSYLDKPSVILPITFLISIAGGGIPLTNEFSIPRTLTFMPLFFVGYYAQRKGWLKTIKRANLLWFLIPALALLFIENKIQLDIYGRKPYMESVDIMKRILYVSSSIIISIAFIKVLPQRITLFSGEGQFVLFYYVYHSLVLFALANILGHFNIVVGGVGLVGITLATLSILYGLRRVRIFSMVLQ